MYGKCFKRFALYINYKLRKVEVQFTCELFWFAEPFK